MRPVVRIRFGHIPMSVGLPAFARGYGAPDRLICPGTSIRRLGKARHSLRRRRGEPTLPYPRAGALLSLAAPCSVSQFETHHRGERRATGRRWKLCDLATGFAYRIIDYRVPGAVYQGKLSDRTIRFNFELYRGNQLRTGRNLAVRLVPGRLEAIFDHLRVIGQHRLAGCAPLACILAWPAARFSRGVWPRV